MVYNINESPYFIDYQGIKFYFSSLFYRNKFEKEYLKIIDDEEYKLGIKYKCKINADLMIMLMLYQKIEKRGFKVIKGNETMNPYDIKFDVELVG